MDIAIIRLEAIGDGGNMRFVLVGKGFEQACLPDMGKLVHLSFYTVRQSIVIRQAPKFPIVGKNDFRIAECREFCLVATIYVFVDSVALFCTELLEFSCWNLDLKPFGHGFSRGMSPM